MEGGNERKVKVKSLSLMSEVGLNLSLCNLDWDMLTTTVGH